MAKPLVNYPEFGDPWDFIDKIGNPISGAHFIWEGIKGGSDEREGLESIKRSEQNFHQVYQKILQEVDSHPEKYQDPFFNPEIVHSFYEKGQFDWTNREEFYEFHKSFFNYRAAVPKR